MFQPSVKIKVFLLRFQRSEKGIVDQNIFFRDHCPDPAQERILGDLRPDPRTFFQFFCQSLISGRKIDFYLIAFRGL